jgi:DNA-binding response OmpR family regulator
MELASKYVLVMSPDRKLQRAIREALSAHGAKVLEANTVEQGAQLAETLPVRVVLWDVTEEVLAEALGGRWARN